LADIICRLIYIKIMSRPKPNQLIKKQFDKDKWQRSFENQMVIAERNNIAKVKRYYRDNYNKGIDSFVSEGQTNFQLLFPTEQLSKMYRDMYADIGLQFANWYGKNYQSLISKAFNPAKYRLQWEASFAALGSAVGAQRVTLVKGTALKTLQRITQGAFMTDPEFMALGTAQKARILRNQFNTYSQYQAERLVRTESTNAANFAIGQSAKTIFPGEVLMKEWIASFDDRVRDTHSEAGASEPIKDNEYFMVGGNMMMHPGDPAGGAAEIINCRCSLASFPAAPVEVEGDYTDIGFGIGGGTFGEIGSGTSGFSIGGMLIDATESAVLFGFESVRQFKDQMIKKFSDSGITLDKITASNRLALSQYDDLYKHLDSLFARYNFAAAENQLNVVSLRFKSASNYGGYIKRYKFGGGLTEINLGDEIGQLSSRLFKIETSFSRRWLSVIDEANMHLATATHEMAHVLAHTSMTSPPQSILVRKIADLRSQYLAELKRYVDAGDVKAYNDIFIGRYGQTSVDEFIAETFTEYQLRSNPSKYARLVGELIDESLGL
jgi:hypothetical protein